MTQYEAVVEYAGTRVKVKSDSFEELHVALAGIEELNQDAEFLRREKSVEDVIPVHRRDGDENDYYGLQDRHSRKNVTYGKKRGEAAIPFFPKGEEGFYDPDAMGARGRRSNGTRDSNGRSDGNARNERPPRSEQRGERRNGQQRRGQRAPSSKDDLPF